MGKSSAEGKAQVVDYYLSVHFGICHGPIDALLRVIIKDKEAWAGRWGEGSFPIFQPNLFGGSKKEGGVGGAVHMQLGTFEQVTPPYLASRFGRTALTMPGYRGIATIFFSGGDFATGVGVGAGGNAAGWSKGFTPDQERAAAFANYNRGNVGGKGFYWTSNNPYLPDPWVTVQRIPVAGLELKDSRIPNLVPVAGVFNPNSDQNTPDPNEDEDEDDEPPEVPDAFEEEPLNGYYIGGLPTTAQFVRTTYGWRATEAAIEDDTKHKLLQGVVYRDYGDDANPAHIVWECLTNDDWGMGAPESAFDRTSFLHFANVMFSEKFGMSLMWAQQSTIEAFVTEILDHTQTLFFLNPLTGLYTVHPIRNDYDYDGLLVLDETRMTMRSFQRKGWGETVNEIVLTWTNPENEKESTVTLQDLGNIAVQGGVISDSRNYYGVRNQALAKRIAARDLRSASAPSATFEADLDRRSWRVVPGTVYKVFYAEEGIAGAAFRAMEVSYGKIGSPTIRVKFVEDIFSLPTFGYTVGGAGSAWEPTDALPAPLTYTAAQTAPLAFLTRAGRSDVVSEPASAVMLLGSTDERDTDTYKVVSKRIEPNGSTVEIEVGDRKTVTHALLAGAIAADVETTVIPVLSSMTEGADPAIGGFLIFGDAEGTSEIVTIMSVVPEVGITVRRGQLDTVPRAWPSGTPVWTVMAFDNLDPRTLTADVPVDYKMLPMTSRGILPGEDVDFFSFTPTDRPLAPFRPADCRVGGQRVLREYTVAPTTVPLTWANRNRLTEDTVLRAWTDGNVTPEDGQTTTIQVLRANGAVAVEHAGLAGTSFALPTAGLPGGKLRVRFLSERDGIRSIQGAEIGLTLPETSGYGQNYGANYGG